MSQKIQVKFYPLTSEITTMLRKGKLTAAEWRIWSYLIEIDPWGDRYQDLDSLDVISKCDCSRATFYRAIAKFQKLGLFDIQDKGFSIRNLTGASKLKSADEKVEGLRGECIKSPVEEVDKTPQTTPHQKRLRKGNLKNEIGVSKMRLDSQNCDSNLKNEIGVSKMRLNSQNCDNRSSKPPSNKGSGSPQTIQTYSDFKDSLSESEREDFFEFVEKATRNLTKPINDLEAWLASKTMAGQNRWEVYYNNFQEFKLLQKAERVEKSVENNALAKWQAQIEEQRKRAEKAWESQKKDV
jgi:hypothetical protein